MGRNPNRIKFCPTVCLFAPADVIRTYVCVYVCLMQVALARYKRWSTPPQTRPTARKRPRQELLDQKLLPAFKNGRKLRDYQVGLLLPERD